MVMSKGFFIFVLFRYWSYHLKLYTMLPIDNEKVSQIIELLKSIDVDGETMEYIVSEVSLSDQLLKQMIVSVSETELNALLAERQAAIEVMK